VAPRNKRFANLSGAFAAVRGCLWARLTKGRERQNEIESGLGQSKKEKKGEQRYGFCPAGIPPVIKNPPHVTRTLRRVRLYDKMGADKVDFVMEQLEGVSSYAPFYFFHYLY
jgi:hypothetical protein